MSMNNSTMKKPKLHTQAQLQLAEDVRLAEQFRRAARIIAEAGTCISTERMEEVSKLTGLPMDSRIVYMLCRFETIEK